MRDDYPEAEDTELGIDMSNGNGAKVVTWVAGIGATLITAAIISGVSALWSQSARLAALETKMDFVVQALREKGNERPQR